MPKKPVSIPRDGHLHKLAAEQSNSLRAVFVIAPRDGRKPKTLLFSEAWDAMRDYANADWKDPTIVDLVQGQPFHPGCLVTLKLAFFMKQENYWIDCTFQFTVPKTIEQLKAIHAARKPQSIAFNGPLFKIAFEHRLDDVQLQAHYDLDAQGLSESIEGQTAWDQVGACEWDAAQMSDNVESDLPGKSTITAFGMGGSEPYRHPIRLTFACGMTVKRIRLLHAMRQSAKKPKAPKKTIKDGRPGVL